MINWTYREHRETKNAYKSLAGNACGKWPFGRWRRKQELINFPLESYCHDLPGSFLSSSDVRYQILQFRIGLLNDSKICLHTDLSHPECNFTVSAHCYIL